MCDGDTEDGQGGQKGWSGWGPYAAVYGKTASATGLVTLVGEAPGGDLTLSEEDMKYDAQGASITVDGDPSDWADAEFKSQIPFEKGGELVLFEEYGGGTWSGPADHSSAVAFAWDAENLYIGVVVTDDTHQNGGSGWNGDSIQAVFANAAQDTVTHLYNYALNDNGDVVVHNERGPGGTELAVTRDEDTTTTLYEIKLPAASLGLDAYESGMSIGVGLCVNDGDTEDGQGGQKGWSGWGPYAAVYGKTASATGLVNLVGDAPGGAVPAPVSHWNFDDGETVTDQAGANDGTVLKNVTFSTDTPDGSAHSIDLTGKNNYVRIGEASPGGPTFGIEATSSFTISAWVKYESSERGIVTVRQDLTSGGGDRSGMTLGINANGNPFVGMIPCCDSTEFRDITTNQEVPTGTWTHLAATYDSDSDTLAVYVNGEAATGYTSNSAGSPADDGSNATGGIGGFDWTDTNGSFTGFGAAGNAPAHGSSAGDFTRLFYSGLLDEVAIWNQALNADQIAGLAGSGTAAPALSIVNNGDGTVTVTFEGRLEAAASVNGPWQDTGATSPLTTPANEAMQYARAVKD